MCKVYTQYRQDIWIYGFVAFCLSSDVYNIPLMAKQPV